MGYLKDSIPSPIYQNRKSNHILRSYVDKSIGKIL